MKFLRSWLEEYVDLGAFSNEQIMDAVTNNSSEVEGFDIVTDYFGGKVVVGRIENLRKHPDADRLNIFDVIIDSKGSKVQIVSAAPNARDGLYVPTALVGAVLPDFAIAERQMRGEVSQGMCCGQSELLLETEFSSGLWELDTSEEDLGQSICDFAPDSFIPDALFDIKVLPDRIGSIGNYCGMAIEVAMCLGDMSLLKGLAKDIYECNFEAIKARLAEVKNSSRKAKFSDDTGYSTMFNLYDLKIKKEFVMPKELRRRMFLSEVNMGGGLADLSNYLLKDMGQPTHFFSRAKVAEDLDWQIETVLQDTKFKGLGQLKKAVLGKGVRVIKDNTSDKIMAVPGISGGDSTKTEHKDTEIVVEIANFRAEEVARNSFRLRYRNDGGKIWAGGVTQVRAYTTLYQLLSVMDAFGIEYELERLLEWSEGGSGCADCNCGGGSCGHSAAQTADELLTKHKYLINHEYITKRIGDEGLNNDGIENILKLYGEVRDGSVFVNPVYKQIVDRESMLVEVSTKLDYEAMTPQQLKGEIANETDGFYSNLLKLKSKIAEFGFDEVITRPFVAEQSNDSIEVLKPQNQDLKYLRNSLQSTLLNTLSKNLVRGVKEPKIMEYNRVYTQNDGKLVTNKVLGLVFISEDPYYATTVVNSVLSMVSPVMVSAEKSENVVKYVAHNASAVLTQVDNQTKKANNINLKKRVWTVEFDLTDWNGELYLEVGYSDMSEYPSATRSYSFSVSSSTLSSDIVETISSVELSDGMNISIKPVERLTIEGQEVVSYDVEFSSLSSTIGGEDINTWEMAVLSRLSKMGVKQR